MTSTHSLTLVDISAAAFAPYGKLLDTPGEIERRDFAAPLVNERPEAKANLALLRVPQAPARMHVDQMERHPFSIQTFFPLNVADYLVVVAPDDGAGTPMPEHAIAFRVPGTQAINYDVGSWHYGMTALGGAGTFAMLIFEDGSKDDTHFREVDPFEVVCAW